jgi:hypothetical protein
MMSFGYLHRSSIQCEGLFVWKDERGNELKRRREKERERGRERTLHGMSTG